MSHPCHALSRRLTNVSRCANRVVEMRVIIVETRRASPTDEKDARFHPFFLSHSLLTVFFFFFNKFFHFFNPLSGMNVFFADFHDHQSLLFVWKFHVTPRVNFSHILFFILYYTRFFVLENEELKLNSFFSNRTCPFESINIYFLFPIRYQYIYLTRSKFLNAF